MRSSRRHFALAAAAYLAAGMWAYRVVLPDPTSLLPAPTRLEGRKGLEIYLTDRAFVVAAVATGAQRILSGDFDLLQQPSCFPLARSGTLGEHMIGESLLGAIPQAIVGEPILTLNAVNLLSLWIGALSMYVLARFWTGSPGAAFIAGLMFALHPAKITNPAHPFGFGNFWTPLALLAAHQLMTKNRWRDALSLALFLCLQLTESFYQVVTLLFLGGSYGLYLAVRFRSSLLRLAPKLGVVALITAVVAALIFGPYLHTRGTWGVLQGRAAVSVLVRQWQYLPGGGASVGWTGLVLAAVGLLDRLRGPRRRDGYDPRLALTAAGLLVLWASTKRLRIAGWSLTSPFLLLKDFLPGLDAIRVPAAFRFGVFLVVAFLAAYGVTALTERLPRLWRALAVALLSAVVLVETLHPPLAKAVYAYSPELAADRERPSDETLALFAKAPPGAVLDLPLSRRGAFLPRFSNAVFLGAYHGRPVAACYNSFTTELGREVERLSEALPDERAADALHALGFRVLALHTRALSRSGYTALRPLLDDPTRAAPIGTVPRAELLGPIELHELRSSAPVTEDPAALIWAAPTPARLKAEASAETSLSATIANSASATFRQPTPIEPSPAVVEWSDSSGRVLERDRIRVLLPAALAAGDEVTREVKVTAPPTPGDYEAVVSLDARPEPALARAFVTVEPARIRPKPRLRPGPRGRPQPRGPARSPASS